MSRKEIIEQLAKDRVIENLAAKVCRGEQSFDLDDLAQDLYLDLMGKKEGKVEKMYGDGELDYYIYRMICNNVYSKTSPYYKKYKELRILTDDKENKGHLDKADGGGLPDTLTR